MEVSGQFHALATLPLGKEPHISTGWDARWDTAELKTQNSENVLYIFFSPFTIRIQINTG
jgi:hypothetical protein